MATTSCRRWRKTPWTKALAWRRSIRRLQRPAAAPADPQLTAHHSMCSPQCLCARQRHWLNNRRSRGSALRGPFSSLLAFVYLCA